MNKALILMLSLIIANSGYAEKENETILGGVSVVKRTTIANLTALLQTCQVIEDYKTSQVVTHILCEVVDQLSAPTDLYVSTPVEIAKAEMAEFGSGNAIGNISITAGGGRGVRAVAYGYYDFPLSEMKKAVATLFEKKQLEGKKYDFYAHVLKNRVE